MRKHYQQLVSAGFLSVCMTGFMTGFVTGCMEGPAGPSLSGSLTGYVTLVDANGSQPARRDSVQVTLQGSSQKVFTDSSGKWTLPDLKTGIYTIAFEKNGYGKSESVQLQFTGGSDKNLGTVFLCAPPSFSVSSLAALGLSGARNDSNSVYLGVTLTKTDITGPYRIYLVLAPDTNLPVAPTPRSMGSFFTTNFTNGVDSTDIRLTPASLVTSGFAPGDTIYAAAYAANAGGNNSGYLDTLTGKTLFTNVNGVRGNVVKIVIPKFTGMPLAGSLGGSVILVDVNGDQHVRRDSVQVSIGGTGLVASTDANGDWSIPGVKNGAYTVSFTKTGYGLVKANVNQANGTGKNIGTVYLCKAPAFSVGDLSLLSYSSARNDSASVYLGAKLSDTTVQGLYRVYLVLSLDPKLSAAPSENATDLFFNAYFRKGVNNVDLHLTPAILANAGFQSGDTLYAEAFTANAGGINSSYPDSSTGKPVYTNLNPKGSNSLKFVVP